MMKSQTTQIWQPRMNRHTIDSDIVTPTGVVFACVAGLALRLLP